MKRRVSEVLKIGITANILEWYDFSIYASMASIIGDVFFGHDQKLALIKAFLIFSVSYLARPLGSLFFGYLADNHGRKIALRFSLLMMAIPTVLIGLLPDSNHLKYFSIITLIILRLVQGFGAGGELPGSSCYVYEIAPDSLKNFFCSFVASSSMLGVFIGSLTVYLMHVMFSDSQIMNWAWRIPFLIGGVFSIIIYQLRNSIKETEDFKNINNINRKNFLKQVWLNKTPIIQVFFLNTFISTTFYLLFVWMPSYLHVFLNLPAKSAFLSNSIGLFTLIILTLLMGYLFKNSQRKTALITGIFFICAVSWPLLTLVSKKIFILIVLTQITFALGLSLIDGVITATSASIFNPKTRCSGMSIGFTFSTAIFGGLSPTICAYLIYKTGSNLSPIIFLITTGIAALAAALSLPKTNEKLSQQSLQ